MNTEGEMHEQLPDKLDHYCKGQQMQVMGIQVRIGKLNITT